MSRRDFDLGPLAYVEHHKDGDRSTLVFIRQLRHAPDVVWHALTDPGALREWAPFDADRSLDSTGPATLRMIDGDRVEEFRIDVRRAVQPLLLEYTWGDDLLRWELAAEDSGTRLTLRHTVDSPEWLSRTAAGWHICLAVAERLMDGDPVGRIVGEDAKQHGWIALEAEYAKRLQRAS